MPTLNELNKPWRDAIENSSNPDKAARIVINLLAAQRDELLDALQMVLPLAEQYLRKAPDHPDNAKLETARAAIARCKE